MRSTFSRKILILVVSVLAVAGSVAAVLLFRSPRNPPLPYASPADGDREEGKQNWRVLLNGLTRSDSAAAKSILGRKIFFRFEAGPEGSNATAATLFEDDDGTYERLNEAMRQARDKPARLKAMDALDKYLRSLPGIPCVFEAKSEAAKKALNQRGGFNAGGIAYGVLRKVDVPAKRIWVELTYYDIQISV